MVAWAAGLCYGAAMLRLLLATTAALAVATAGQAAPVPRAEIRIMSRAIPLNPADPAQTSVGRLQYMGGLELRSPDARFGGISGMRLQPTGELIAVTDAGSLLRMRLVERGGRLVGVEQADLGSLPGPDARPMRGKMNNDAEALELEADGRLTVAFERRHRLYRYPPEVDRAREVTFIDADWLSRLPENSGVEAMARVGGLWLYIAEETDAKHPNAVISRTAEPGLAYNRIAVQPLPGYSPTDAHALDAERFLLLSRSFSPMNGARAAVQIFTVDPQRLEVGPGESVGILAPPLTVDNMEALAVRHDGRRTFVYIASDDNFSPLQGTILLKFELMHSGSPPRSE